MIVWVTGATGLIGGALCQALARDCHTVYRLIRPGKAPGTREFSKPPNVSDLPWSAATGISGVEAALTPDAIINLAGASIADGAWTAERKAELRASRVAATRSVVEALTEMPSKPRVFLSASAMGYYGDRGDEELTEESGPGRDFLAELAQEWEGEAEKAEEFGVRVVRMRFGIVLAKRGGALPRMARPFRLGFGGRISTGRQWISWIALADVVGAVRFLLAHPEIRGAVNVVAPQPVRNAEFAKGLAHALHRPAIFPVPAFALRMLLGPEMANALLLSSQRVLPKKLQQSGFSFLYPELPAALAANL
jgi:uncharacterized protein (TIGR01777 family)